MASKLQILVEAQTKAAEQRFRKLEKEVRRFTRSTKSAAPATASFGSSLQSLLVAGAAAAGITLTAKSILDLGRAAVKNAARFESLQLKFEVLTGSLSKGRKLFDDIRRFTATTPFRLNDVAIGAQRLQSFGVAQKDIISTLRTLGDVAGGVSSTLDRLTLAYGKIVGKGKAGLEEINQFTEAGVPLLDALSKVLEIAKPDVFGIISKEGIPLETIDEALKQLTTNTGQFAGLTEKMAKTFEGSLSTLQDKLQELSADLGEGILPYLKFMIELVNKFLAAAKKISKFLPETLPVQIKDLTEIKDRNIGQELELNAVLKKQIEWLELRRDMLEKLGPLTDRLLNIRGFFKPGYKIGDVLGEAETEIFTQRMAKAAKEQKQKRPAGFRTEEDAIWDELGISRKDSILSKDAKEKLYKDLKDLEYYNNFLADSATKIPREFYNVVTPAIEAVNEKQEEYNETLLNSVTLLEDFQFPLSQFENAARIQEQYNEYWEKSGKLIDTNQRAIKGINREIKDLTKQLMISNFELSKLGLYGKKWQYDSENSLPIIFTEDMKEFLAAYGDAIDVVQGAYLQTEEGAKKAEQSQYIKDQTIILNNAQKLINELTKRERIDLRIYAVAVKMRDLARENIARGGPPVPPEPEIPFGTPASLQHLSTFTYDPFNPISPLTPVPEEADAEIVDFYNKLEILQMNAYDRDIELQKYSQTQKLQQEIAYMEAKGVSVRALELKEKIGLQEIDEDYFNSRLDQARSYTQQYSRIMTGVLSNIGKLVSNQSQIEELRLNDELDKFRENEDEKLQTMIDNGLSEKEARQKLSDEEDKLRKKKDKKVNEARKRDFEFNKAISMVEATIQGLLLALQLASPPPKGLGPIAGPILAGALTITNLSLIGAQKYPGLAEGGLVKGAGSQGNLFRLGDKNRDELVIPLDRLGMRSRFGAYEDNRTISIKVDGFVGSPDELVEKIDERLYQLTIEGKGKGLQYE